jgi:uncharacterized membrane protein YidH (DUF202 family)
VSTRLDVEEIQTTKGEKLLAVVLAVFLLIGGIWAYVKIDNAVRTSTPPDYSYRGTPAEQAAVNRLRAADRRLAHAQRAAATARDNLELRREAYRTALDANRPAPQLEKAYNRAQARLTRTQSEVSSASVAVAAAQPDAIAAQRAIDKVRQGRQERRELLAFVFRLAFVLASIAFSYWLLARLRRRMSRYYPVAMAFVGYAAILAVFMAADYLTDYFDPLELGPLVLSLFGIAATLLAMVALQRYLAKRLPYRRVRKNECPFCGYPVRGNEHCEHCGREVIAPCAQCSEPRRVGALHCGACGAV